MSETVNMLCIALLFKRVGKIFSFKSLLFTNAAFISSKLTVLVNI